MLRRTLLKAALTGLVLISLASTAAEFPPPLEEPSIKRQHQLHQMLLQDCSVCHGKLLRGGTAPALTPETLGAKSERVLVRTIIEGHDETMMPAWAWKLEEYEARWLLRFIHGGRISGK